MAQIWAPHVIENINNSELDLYLQFSTTACIPGGGCNVDDALQVLYKSNGDIKLAMQQLLAFQVNCQAIWSLDEMKAFERLVRLHGKDFHLISQDLTTKTVKECVLFYYLWKKRRPISTVKQQYHQQQQANHITTSSDVVNNNNNNQQHSDNHQKIQLPKIEQQKLLEQVESFPCRVCGRVFAKIKSRSAHMKRHKNER